MRQPYHLRPSEINFLKPIAGGYTQEEAAKLLGISEHTASSHADNIRAQMNLPKLEAAAALAICMGYFTIFEVQFKFKDPTQLPWSDYPRKNNNQP